MHQNPIRSFLFFDRQMPRFVTVYCLPALVLSWLILAFYCYARVLIGQTAAGLSDGAGHPFGDCFINFWSAAKLAVMGRVADIYSWEGLHAFEQSAVHADLIYFHYSYPPVMPVLTWPLALMPYVPALFAWVFATWAAFYAALRAARPAANALVFSLATPAFLLDLSSGQNGALTAALLGGGLTLLPKRPVLAGILFGLLCFKPQLVFLAPVALVCGRQWRTLTAAALAALALVALSLVLYGPALWLDYLHTAEKLRHYVLEDNTAQSWQQFVSVFVAARQLGVGIAASYFIQGIFALAALFAVIRLWAGSASHEARCAALVIGTFLATPYAMNYDLVVMAFAAVWLGRAYPEDRLAVGLAVAMLFAMPLVAAVCGTFYGIGVGPLMLLPGCWLILSSCSLPRKKAGY